MVKHVGMSSFLNVSIFNITNLGGNRIVRNADVKKTRHFNMFHHVIST